MPEKDFFRDTWVRYLVMYPSLKRSMPPGYANEVGEAFRPVVPGAVVTASYKVAFFYVAVDTMAKTWKMIKHDGRPKKVMVAAGDAFIWQTLASVVIPGITINRISAYSGKALNKYTSKLPLHLRRALTVGIGLASIPIIVHPIDMGVTFFMNITYRCLFDVK